MASSNVPLPPHWELTRDRSLRRQRADEWIVKVGASLVVLPVFVFLLVPTAAVVLMAFTPRGYVEFPPSGFSTRHLTAFFSDRRWIDAIADSLQVAALAVAIAVVTGTAAAIALGNRAFRGKGALLGFLLAPVAAPVVALALAHYLLFSRYGLQGSVLAIGLAHGLLTTPFVFLTVAASLAGLDPAVVAAARSLGAKWTSVFRHAYLPVVAPGVLGGALLAFAVSLDEPVIAFFLQGVDATTLPVKMFSEIRYALTPTIAVASALVVSVAVLFMILHLAFIAGRRVRRGPLAAGRFAGKRAR